jgi:magnesium-transporting ATPase (P-type)
LLPGSEEESTEDRAAHDAAGWAALDPEGALARLAVDRDGLAAAEAAARLRRHGPNALPAAVRRLWYAELGANFVHLFALLLWAGAALAVVAGMPQLAWAIGAVVVINGLFSYWQEYEAERAAEALSALLPRRVTVRRDGAVQMVAAPEIVPGDVLVLAEGEAIPADARILDSERLRIDLSSLTGESRPVPRFAHAVDSGSRAAAALPNIVFAGTTVVGGRADAVVFATGAATEFGRIASLTQAQRERPSPLQQELSRVTRFVTVLAVAFGVLCFAVGTGVGGLSPAAAFLFAIGIIVANVPEGLLPTLTLALAFGVRRMAARRALIKRLSAVETLGATTLILTDKTGTLTENEMTVRELWVDGARYRVEGAGYQPLGAVRRLPGEGGEEPDAGEGPMHLLRAAALCCDAHLLPPGGGRVRWQAIGDPTEAAILVAAAKLGLGEATLSTWPRLAELPFDSARKRMTTIQRINGDGIACVKGAPSEVLPRCASIRRDGRAVALEAALRQEVEAAQVALTSRGLRVLAVAERSLPTPAHDHDNWRVDEVERALTLIGLVAMEDPPRPEVPAALADCRRAGVRVVMVTGDDGRTATAVGREIGLCGEHPEVVTGADLDAMDEAHLAAVLCHDEIVFARLAPEHKLRLVESYQRRGEVVAVTGDGVNDAPALRRADIGVAMGATGTDVAREAADMVLADDNFASIVAAIEEGRGVYDNVRKFVTYIFASNVPEIVPFAAFVLLGIPLPLTVMQILAVDLGTDLVPALALGMEKPEPDVMRRPPRSRHDRLLSFSTLLRAYGWLGAIEAALSLFGFFAVYWLAGWRPGQPMADSGPLYAMATTMSLAGIVACQIGNLFACRSRRESVFHLGLTGNRVLLAGIAVEVAVLLLLIHVPALARTFALAPLEPLHWLLLATFAPLLLAAEELRKWLLRRRASVNPTR